MKKIFHLLYAVLLIFLINFNVRAEEQVQNYFLDSLDLAGFNDKQIGILKEETIKYGMTLAPLMSQGEQGKQAFIDKVNAMLVKLKEGIRVYKIARDPKVDENVADFEKLTDTKLYVLCFVDDAFLNNIFYRLAEAYYETTRPNKYVIVELKYTKGSTYKEEKPVYIAGKPNIKASDEVKSRINKKLDEANALVYNDVNIPNGTDIGDGQFETAVAKGVDDLSAWFGGAGLNGVILGPIDCIKFCNMCGAERCAFILSKVINQYGYSSYLIGTPGKDYHFKGTIKLDAQNELTIEKDFINDPQNFEEYSQYLQAWGVDYIYAGIIERDYPKTQWADYIPWGSDNTCKDHCINFGLNKEAPPVVKFIADVITSPISAPGKIIYGKNFIFEDEEVTTLDRGLAFLDIPGIGVVTKTVALKLGIKAMIVGGIVKTLAAGEVINDIIKKSGVSDAIASLAKNSLKTLAGTKNVFVFKGLTDKVIKVEEISDFVKIVNENTSGKWDDILEAWNKGSRNIDNPISNLVDDVELKTIIQDIKFLPGPQLPKKIAATFENGIYVNRKIVSNERYYKYHGIDNRTGKKYTWVVKNKYVNEKELREGLAIRDDWGVKIEYVSEFDVPAGTWVSEGKAAAQGLGYPGGDYQGVILNIPKTWIIRTDKAF